MATSDHDETTVEGLSHSDARNVLWRMMYGTPDAAREYAEAATATRERQELEPASATPELYAAHAA